MAQQRIYASVAERNRVNGLRLREREREEYERGMALVRRVRRAPKPDPKALEAIALYREEKAKRAAEGFDFNGSSGRHPIIHEANNSTRGLLRVAL